MLSHHPVTTKNPGEFQELCADGSYIPKSPAFRLSWENVVLALTSEFLSLSVLGQFKIQRLLACSDSLSVDSWFLGDSPAGFSGTF